jgi:serralysin
MSNEPRVCMDVILPVSAEELAMTNMWSNGKRLRVHFLGGDSFLHEKVKNYARKWEPYANIFFDFVNDQNAEIRVAFKMDGTSWSAVGTDALNLTYFPTGSATMNYGWLTGDSDENEFSRVIVHEFGHAIGCIHEHQNPAGNIPWNKDAVYRYYADRGWNKARVDQNLFRKYDLDQSQYTEFDKESIMLYPVPKELTDGKMEVGWNRHLSETDKQFIAKKYPKPQG